MQTSLCCLISPFTTPRPPDFWNAKLGLQINIYPLGDWDHLRTNVYLTHVFVCLIAKFYNKAWDITEYGMSHLDDLLAEIPPSTAMVSVEGHHWFSSRSRVFVIQYPTTIDLQDLLGRYSFRHIISITTKSKFDILIPLPEPPGRDYKFALQNGLPSFRNIVRFREGNVSHIRSRLLLCVFGPLTRLKDEHCQDHISCTIWPRNTKPQNWMHLESLLHMKSLWPIFWPLTVYIFDSVMGTLTTVLLIVLFCYR